MEDKRIFSKNLIWLFLGLLFQYFSGGDQPYSLAVWLAPIFLLRFFRDSGVIKGCIFALPLLTGINILAYYGMTPFPSFSILLIVFLLSTVWSLIPYLLDRLFYRSSPMVFRILLFPSLVVAIPFIRSSQGTWFHPVNAIDDLTFLQVGSLAGMAGISFLIYLMASIVNEIWENRQHKKIFRTLSVVLLGVLTLTYGFGIIRLNSGHNSNRALRAAGLIPDPAMREKLLAAFPALLRSNPEKPEDIETLRHTWKKEFSKLLSESTAMADFGFDLVVWPEGATILFEDEEQELVGLAKEKAKSKGISLGLSVMVFLNKSRAPNPGIQPIFKNKLIIVSSEGRIEWEHAKSYLAPGMEAAVTIAGEKNLKSSRLGQVKVSGAICYEMDFPKFIRQAGQLGSELILAPSNDWPEIKNMHARMSRLRAIENGISVFRPTAGGISIAVDPYGRALSQVDNSAYFSVPVTAVVPIDRKPTLYAAWGDYFSWICAAASFVLLFLGLLNLLFPKKLGLIK